MVPLVFGPPWLAVDDAGVSEAVTLPLVDDLDRDGVVDGDDLGRRGGY
jgi:hypothetical protein